MIVLWSSDMHTVQQHCQYGNKDRMIERESNLSFEYYDLKYYHCIWKSLSREWSMCLKQLHASLWTWQLQKMTSRWDLISTWTLHKRGKIINRKVICSRRKGNMFLQKLPSNCHQMLAEYETLPDLNSGRCFWTLGLFAHAEAGGR